MENSTLLVYSSYPKVLFDHAKNHNSIKKYFEDAQIVLDALMANDQEFYQFLRDNNIDKSERKKVIEEVFKGKIQNFFLWFLFTIVDLNRCYFLIGIIRHFLAMCDKEFGINYVKIYSVFPLNEKQMDKIINALKKHYQLDIRATNIIDKKLIGGIKIVSDIDSINNSYIDKLNHIKYSSIKSMSQISNEERKK